MLAIWRHGDRAPKMKPYADDKHDENAWPRGWSQLTNEGMVQNVANWAIFLGNVTPADLFHRNLMQKKYS